MKKLLVTMLILGGVIVFGVLKNPTITSSVPATQKAAAVPLAVEIPPVSHSLSVTPKTILQGDPLMITIDDEVSDIASATVGTTPIHFNLYDNHAVAFYGSAINQKTGLVLVSVVLKDGTKLSSSFTIAPRTHPVENLPVPIQLGGNSTSSQVALVSNLEKENAELAAVYSNPTQAFWTSAFAFPVKSAIVVTDPYGYDRDSGVETIIHKGTDFKASLGTPVYAINRGVVRTAKRYTVYGDTIIVDHGLGVESFYMHLSKILVTPDELVSKGEIIGYSGDTGYAEGPHLHLTIRINGQSIDPMKFFALFGLK